MKLLIKLFLIIFWLDISNTSAEEPEKVKQLLTENKDLIFSSALLFNVQPRLIASIIYVERTLNVNWMEGQLDILLAKAGYSSSIGLGQVKIHTAEWIEKKLHDSTSKYYLGDAYRIYLSKSKSRDEMIERLENPIWNIKYVTAYIAMFCRRWLNDGFNISTMPNIIATLYSLGPYHVSDGSERKPHANPKSNYFGEETAKFYYSDQLIFSFPSVKD